MQVGSDWILAKAKKSLFPEQVEGALVQLAATWPQGEADLRNLIENFVLGEDALLHLFAMSSVCTNRLIQNPDLLVWLSKTEISGSGRTYAEMSNELYAGSDNGIAANNFQALRRWKGREMTRIALRELSSAAE